jgi:hypothetical protein
MHDEHGTETKQRLADHRMETAVWPDAYLEKEPKEISFEHLGGRCILPAPQKFAPRSAKPLDFSSVYGDTGKLVRKAPESDASDESKDGEANTD